MGKSKKSIGKWLNLLLIIGSNFSLLFAQNSLTFTDTLSLKKDTLALQHTHIVPFSISLQKINGAKDTNPVFIPDYTKGKIYLKNPSLTDSIWIVTYRYFVNAMPNVVAMRTTENVTDTLEVVKYVPMIGNNDNVDLLEQGKLRKSGSITRGITVGNSQGTTLNSGMKLQIEGDLGDGLKIVGSITDDNIPIQPDGSTQQISDFDKIFIQLRKDAYFLTIGDFEVQQKGSRFGDIYRNVQGLQVGYNTKKTRIQASGAVAKGKFHTNSFIGKDGVSGPYRLTGKSGEQFFTVLAGSEKVYLNGKLMVRGENQDYVMDYNTAQLTFTPKHIITNITRIVVDFEYTDRFFNRSLLFAQAEHQMLKNKLSLKFSFARDADNPNAPFDNAAAYNAIRDSLALMGDAQGGVVYTSGVTVDTNFSLTQPFYLKKDTLHNGNFYPNVYVYSLDSTVAIYRLFFSFVGVGKGNYTRDPSGVNNYVYKWVAPNADGSPSGEFEPVRPWVLPKLLDVYNLQAKYQISEKWQVYTENALSIEDKNRLSSKGDEDNASSAHTLGIKTENQQIKDSLFFSTDVNYTFVNQKYNNLDRVYKAEYGRIWNFDDARNVRTNEQVVLAKTQLNWKEKIKLQTEWGLRNTGLGKSAFRQVYTLNSTWRKGIQGNYTFTQIRANEDSITRTSQWLRHEGDVFYQWHKVRVGTEIWIENKNERRADTLSQGALSFTDLKPYIRMGGEEKLQLDFSFNYRKDREFFENQYRYKSLAFTHYYKAVWNPSNAFKIQAIGAYRTLTIKDTAFIKTGINTNRVLNANLQTTYTAPNKLLYVNLLYDVTSEQISQRDIRFIQVNNGQGEYEWIDGNGDNISSVNEFVYSNNPLKANYIRVVLPTQVLIPTTKPTLQTSVRWDLKPVFKKSKNPVKETIRNFRAFTTVRIAQNRQRENRLATYWVLGNENDTSLLDMTFNFRQECSFFQNSAVGDLKFGYQNTQSKQFLSTGNETRRVEIGSFSQRVNLDASKSIEVESNLGRRITDAANFPTKNYDIRFFDTNPKINWQTNRKLRFSMGYQYKYKANTNSIQVVDSKVNMHKFILENRWNIKNRNNLNVKVEMVKIGQKQAGDGANFVTNYEMLESLKPGYNAIWNTFLSFYLTKDLELGVTYEGRASQKTETIHTGRVQVRAFF